jgi:hypothetical protein
VTTDTLRFGFLGMVARGKKGALSVARNSEYTLTSVLSRDAPHPRKLRCDGGTNIRGNGSWDERSRSIQISPRLESRWQSKSSVARRKGFNHYGMMMNCAQSSKYYIFIRAVRGMSKHCDCRDSRRLARGGLDRFLYVGSRRRWNGQIRDDMVRLWYKEPCRSSL